jgi:drug/metabolite transporter (DMT)-like permease
MLKFAVCFMKESTDYPDFSNETTNAASALRRRRQHWLADGCFLLITFIWGFSFVVVKNALREVPMFYFNALRFGVATVILIPFTFRQWRAWKPSILPGSILAMFLYVGFAFQTAGLKYTTPSKSAFITSSAAIAVPIFLFLFFRKKSDLSALLGVLVAFAGLYLLSVPSNNFNLNHGDTLTAICAAAWSFHIIFTGRFSPFYPLAALATFQIVLAGIGFWLTALGSSQIGPVPRTAVPAILYGGILATALCFGLQLWAQRHTSPTRAGLLLTTEPLFASATSYFWTGERLTGREAIGGALILVAVILAEVGYQWRFQHGRFAGQAIDL